MTTEIQPTDVLVVVDVQYDFLPGGALAVKDGDQVSSRRSTPSPNASPMSS